MHRNRTRIGATLAVAAAAAALLAGCGSSHPGATAAPAAPATSAPAIARPLNPVTILRQAGFKPDPGQVYGTTVINGDLSASSTVKDASGNDLESVNVYTSANQANYQEALSTPTPSDTMGVVAIPSKLAVVVINIYQPGASPTPQQIAARMHGQVVQPQA
jgi:hypothetical protein